MTRAFAFFENSQPIIAVEWQKSGEPGQPTLYNFTHAWELFKQIKLKGKGPQLPFLQIMVEMDLFQTETFDEVFSTLEEFRSLADLIIHDEPHPQLPIARPQKILGIGRNYRAHAQELDNSVPSEPIFFAKSPSALIPHREAIRIPLAVGAIHHEGELAVVVGKAGANIPEKQALEYVAGYTLVNDVTARELQKRDIAAALPWFRSKNFDTFCPLGPALVPRDCIADPQALELNVTVNDEPRQRSSTTNMIFPVTELISYLSRHCTLQPGDVIATGTPSGVGPLTAGDIVTVSIDGIGDLVNPVS